MNTQSLNRKSLKLLLSTTCGLFLAGSLFAAPTTQPLDAGILPPIATAPAASAKAALIAIPYRPYLPPARMGPEPHMLKSDGQHGLRERRAIDIPPVATFADVPAEPTLAAGPGIRIVLPASATIPVATLAAGADSGRPTLKTDPTLDMAPASALTASAPPRSSSPPLLLLSVPDPSRQFGALPVPQSTTEDPPVKSLDRPAVPVLPVGK